LEIACIDIAVDGIKNDILVSWMIAAKCCQQKELLLGRPVDYIFIDIYHWLESATKKIQIVYTAK